MAEKPEPKLPDRKPRKPGTVRMRTFLALLKKKKIHGGGCGLKLQASAAQRASGWGLRSSPRDLPTCPLHIKMPRNLASRLDLFGGSVLHPPPSISTLGMVEWLQWDGALRSPTWQNDFA